MEKKQQQQLPPDEERCSQCTPTWRCKNFRMGYGPTDDDSVPKSKRCEKHYNYYVNYHKNRGDGEGAGSGPVEKTSGSKRGRKKKVTEEEDDWSFDDTSDSDTSSGGISANFVTDRIVVERIEGSGEIISLTGIRGPLVETRAAKRRKMVMEGELFLDETSNQPATNDYYDSDTIIGGGSADNDRKRKYAETMSGEQESLTGYREPAVELESLEHYKTKCFELSAVLERKELELEKKELELEKKTVELQKRELELEKKELERNKKKVQCTKLQGKLAEVDTRKTAATNEIERTPADATECLSYLESQVHRKENENATLGCLESCISNLESQVLRMESENSTKAERVESRILKLESQLLKMESEKSTTTGCVDSRISNLESLVQRMESGNSAMAGCVDSRISNLESHVLRSGNESAILRCVELRNSERVEFDVRGLQNDSTQSGEKPIDEINRSKLNAETSSGGRKDSHVFEFGTKEKVLNLCNNGFNKHRESESQFPKYSGMNISSGILHLSSEGHNIEEGKGWGSSSKRHSQHGSPSHDHLETGKEHLANLVSDGGESLGESEDSDSSGDSETSLGSLMVMLAMKYRNTNNNKEMKWKSEPDMLSSFEKDTELCMKAVCALYRQEISIDELSPKGLFFDSDTLRVGWQTKVFYWLNFPRVSDKRFAAFGSCHVGESYFLARDCRNASQQNVHSYFQVQTGNEKNQQECTTLAKFLMAEDCKGDLKKSVDELEVFDSAAIADCKRLAKRYSVHLFDIYQNGKDPFFLPAANSCHGDQTAK